MSKTSLTTWINITLPVRLEPHDESGGYTAVCPTINGVSSEGRSYSDALSSLREAIAIEAERAVARAEAADHEMLTELTEQPKEAL